jgi:hypothetical protein
MPKEITHCILAERAARTMAASSNTRKQTIGREIYFQFEKNPQLLYFGSVAPDIFFYDIALPWEFRVRQRGLPWGELIHGTQGENSLTHIFEMIAILQSREKQMVLTGGRQLTDAERNGLLLFVFGYLSHVALDTVMHPIVYYFAGNYYAAERHEKLRAEARHRAIETVLDLFNLARIENDLNRYRGIKKMQLPDSWRNLVLGLFTQSLVNSWPEQCASAFGDVKPGERGISAHPLFRIAIRGYKKQMLFNRVFQNSQLARFGLWYNRRRSDALHFHSSLLYPARSYKEYMSANTGQLMGMGDLRSYHDPLTDRALPINPEALTRKALARCHAFWRVASQLAEHEITPEGAANVLRGYSLNNGRVGIATDQMKYFGPLPINGNFEYLNGDAA